LDRKKKKEERREKTGCSHWLWGGDKGKFSGQDQKKIQWGKEGEG